MIAVTERDHAAYVSSIELENRAAIAIKLLPSADRVVACSEERCAQLEHFVHEGGVVLVDVAELAKALGVTARFSDDRRQVQLDGSATAAPTADAANGVGDFVPNLRLITIGGAQVSLADFRGKRLLIQSWGSW